MVVTIFFITSLHSLSSWWSWWWSAQTKLHHYKMPKSSSPSSSPFSVVGEEDNSPNLSYENSGLLPDCSLSLLVWGCNRDGVISGPRCNACPPPHPQPQEMIHAFHIHQITLSCPASRRFMKYASPPWCSHLCGMQGYPIALIQRPHWSPLQRYALYNVGPSWVTYISWKGAS